MQRAQWKLVPGKNAARLSEHYKLDCDYGTAVIEIYKAGEATDPIYLCESHVGDVRRANAKSEIRLVESAVEFPVEALVHAAGGRSELKESAQGIEIPAAKANTPAAPRPVATMATPKLPRVATASRTAVRDLTYGNSAKALVDEAIWNLSVGDYELYKTALRLGKSAGEAAQAAGGQLAVVHRKICEYTVKFETVLAASTARIDAREAVDEPFERAMTEIMGNEAIGTSERDAALDELGALQQSISQSIQRGPEPEITPMQVHRVACAIGERANWGASASISEELKPAYRAIYGSVRKTLRAAVPHANSLEERLTNLFAAKSELENGPSAKALQTLTA